MSRAAAAALIAALMLPGVGAAQDVSALPAVAGAPRLVVVIAVDQLRADYMDRFAEHFGPGGFNLFLRRGARFAAARYEHSSTSTCPGHAVILTGSYADVNGIVGNDWYDVAAQREEYCAADRAERLIGSELEGRSPRNLKGATVGDVLKVQTGGLARVITVSAKDRSAIMLGGHLADGAYWMEDTLFVTSTYYRNDLPSWVRELNGSGAVTAYRGRRWDRLLPAGAYDLSGADDFPAEEADAGMGRTFPHTIAASGTTHEDFVDAFDASPFSNEVVAELAMRAVTAEHLGDDAVPDLLGVSFSANDRVGHAYGPDSHEVLDVTVRLDRVLRRLFEFLDREVGLANVVMVLTADHGVGPMPETVNARHPKAGARRIHPDTVTAAVGAALDARYGAQAGAGWVVWNDAPDLYLNPALLEQRGIALAEAELVARDAVASVPGIHLALTGSERAEQRRAGVESGEVFSFHPGRSGHVYYHADPYSVVDDDVEGADHGSRWKYDQQVPVLWYGRRIEPGTYYSPAAVADIAPTLSALLGLVAPGGSRGRVLEEMLKRAL